MREISNMDWDWENLGLSHKLYCGSKIYEYIFLRGKKEKEENNIYLPNWHGSE